MLKYECNNLPNDIQITKTHLRGYALNIEQVQRILIVGVGTMGQQISLHCAIHGYDVVAYDIDSESLKEAKTQIVSYAAQLVSEGYLTQNDSDDAIARITFSQNSENAAKEVDILSESVPEIPELKKKVLAQFNKICPPRTIFTTNASIMIPSMLAKATGRPGQFAALHFYQDVWDPNLVDIMPHPDTSDETVELLVAFAKRIGLIPILLRKENYGYVFNNLFGGMQREALAMAANGIASVEDIDRAWMCATKMSIGPFGLADKVGLKTSLDVYNYVAKVLRWSIIHRSIRNQIQTCARFLQEYVDKGWLGINSGRGFYFYPDPAYEQSGFLTGEHQNKTQRNQENRI
jgi:3-hydroxybutyryl-CoA dehydrogenase